MTVAAVELRLVDLDALAPGTDIEVRVLDAALALVARWGIAKTSLADVAREAGCSRATVYRAFPGGKQHLFEALAVREVDLYLSAIIEAVDEAESLGDALTRGLVVAARLLRDHDAAQFILEHEPGLFTPFLGFTRVEVVYDATATAIGPHLERFLAADRAEWAAEWSARLFVSYLFKPHASALTSIEQASRIVDTFILPALIPKPY